jgi:hypothetical protein
MCKIVGFLTNKITLRGTEVAVYDYADFNEKILRNKSIIITSPYDIVKHENDVNKQAYNKFEERFVIEYYVFPNDIDDIIIKHKITHLYIIKYGLHDNLITNKCKTLIHCVFDVSQPHGDIYSPISQDINIRFKTNFPVLPHMINNFDSNLNLRAELNINENSLVFGRYGGMETFDIPFVHTVIKNILNDRNDIYFIFMNTDKFYEHPRIIYLEGTSDSKKKREFINTCDALLHARMAGETFGLTCGEFAIQMKPVITWGSSIERNHLNILGDKAVIYNTYSELYEILLHFHKEKYDMSSNGYLFFTPENVMRIFDELFLSL